MTRRRSLARHTRASGRPQWRNCLMRPQRLAGVMAAISLLLWYSAFAAEIPTSERSNKAISTVEDRLKKALSAQGLHYSAALFIRIFKEPGILEVWLRTDSGEFKHFRTYPVCTFSGGLGPKTRQGDLQSPEGFYFVPPAGLNPWSQFHLSFNLGYPNKYDRYHARTGSALMVHGNCVSVGCYAMTDAYIEEIYALAAAALASGQPFFRVHIFPFKMEVDVLDRYRSNPWYSFWLNLQEGYDYFNRHRRPPNVEVRDGVYSFGE